MNDTIELNKQRNIVFSAYPPDQTARAHKLLSGLPDCRVELGNTPNVLQVSYNLRHYTLDGLENALTEEGFHLDHSPLHSIARKVIYYCEDTLCHNLDIPAHPTKKNQSEVFVRAYDHELHGDHDDTPPELREYI